MEIWKDIPGYEGLYLASNLGNIYSLCYKKIMNPSLTKKGYLYTGVCKNKKRLHTGVHRLVALTFIDNFSNKSQVNHINGIKIDNRIENLEWCTPKENVMHSWNIGNSKPSMKGRFGKNHHSSKSIYQYNKDMIFLNEFNGIADANRDTGISNVCISSCCRGKIKSAGGFIWRFKSDILSGKQILYKR